MSEIENLRLEIEELRETVAQQQESIEIITSWLKELVRSDLYMIELPASLFAQNAEKSKEISARLWENYKIINESLDDKGG